MEQFSLGIATGITATIIVAVSLSFFNKVIIPFAKQKLSNAPSLDNDWEIYFSDQMDKLAGKVKLKTNLSGTLVGVAQTFFDRQGDMNERKYSFTGKFSSGILFSKYEDINLPGYLGGVSILKLSHDGKILSGKSSFIHNDTGQIETHDLYLKRLG